MRQKNITFIVCLVGALIFLSLPATTNGFLQHFFAEKILPFSSNASEDLPPHDEVDDWLVMQEKARQKATERVTLPHKVSYLVGKVIYRNQNSWNSSLWIDIGNSDNPESNLECAIIAKNSPVLSRDSVVGMVDYVGKNASLVRLISDSTLQPAVRVARNGFDKELDYAVRVVSHAAKEQFENPDEEKAFQLLLSKLQDEESSRHYLAKGILYGNSEPMWRSASISLKGIGFTYDFKDRYGPARDLRTGEPIDPDSEFPNSTPICLIQTGDLLVTSGLDGLFPEGLKVAKVRTIYPLQEGAISYEIEADPTASDLADLEYVTILPPQKFSEADIPDRLELIKKQLE